MEPYIKGRNVIDKHRRIAIFLVGGCGGMADASDSKSDGGNIVWVQVPPSAVFVLY